jgi:zinc transport system ATP-binding protein
MNGKSPTSPPLVSLSNVRVRLGGADVLRGVDADLPRGGITALIGLNGAGKSTLLRVLVREVPFTGDVRFHCGHDHSHPTPQHIGYVPQKLRVDANLPLTVLDLFALSLQSMPLFFGVSRWVRSKAEALLARVDSTHLLGRQVSHLSGGETQRVLLALALEPDPELLLLDEPAAGIDFRDQERFYKLIDDLNQRTHMTILLVSHELSVVSRLARNVLCLADGRIRCHGAPQEILTTEMLAQTFGPGMAVYSHEHHEHSARANPEEYRITNTECRTPKEGNGNIE